MGVGTQIDRGLGTRGGWYADPYGSPSAQRWYDGSKWTDQVREIGAAEASAKPRIRPAPAHRAVASEPKPEPERPPEPSDFPVRISETVGERLWLVKSSPTRALNLELLSASGRVASLRLHGRGALATVRCAEGSRSLIKRRSLGWSLGIEEPERGPVGWYSGRRWLPGGIIMLASGAQLELLQSLSGGWKVRRAGHETLASIRLGSRHGERTAALTLRSLPHHGPDDPLTILVALAVVTLGRSLPRVSTIAPSA